MKIEKISTSEKKCGLFTFLSPGEKYRHNVGQFAPECMQPENPVKIPGRSKRTASGPLMSSPRERTSGLVKTDFRAIFAIQSHFRPEM